MSCLPIKKLSLLLYTSGILFFSGFCLSQSTFLDHYPDSLNKRRLIATVGIETGAYLTGLSFLEFIWYKDQDRVPFHLYDDRKGYLQMDKAGHAFSAYRQSYAGYYALRWAGVKKNKALLCGAPLGIIFQTPIELFDGLYEDWGFSWSDVIANTAGTALFMIQEALFEEQKILMKFSYSPSGYPQYHPILGETHLEQFFLDYNAHTYWVSGNIKSLTRIEKIPPWINFAFGYSANGMIFEFDNPTSYQGEPFPDFPRYRQYLFSLDIDFTRIETDKKWLSQVFRAVNILKLPFPALEINPVEGFRLRPLYF